MSEQAKLTYIQERLREVKGKERHGVILTIIGAVTAGLSFALMSLDRSIVRYQVLLYLGILGFGLGILGFGFANGVYYAYQRIKLMEQLKTMATTIPKCPKCGKEIPQGNYTFCPFCGASLTPPPP